MEITAGKSEKNSDIGANKYLHSKKSRDKESHSVDKSSIKKKPAKNSTQPVSMGMGSSVQKQATNSKENTKNETSSQTLDGNYKFKNLISSESFSNVRKILSNTKNSNSIEPNLMVSLRSISRF